MSRQVFIGGQFSTPLGRRIKKVDSVASETTLYYNNYNWQVLAQCDGSNNCRRYFVYGNYIDEPLIMVDVNANPDKDYYYVHDHLYSPVTLLNADGTVAERYEYDAYGNMTMLDPDFTTFSGTEAGNPYYFTGRTLDVLDSGDMEIMYYRSRNYNPNMGRFFQHDLLNRTSSVGPEYVFNFIGQYADGVNLYEYVSGMPIISIDPIGLRIIIINNPGRNPFYNDKTKRFASRQDFRNQLKSGSGKRCCPGGGDWGTKMLRDAVLEKVITMPYDTYLDAGEEIGVKMARQTSICNMLRIMDQITQNNGCKKASRTGDYYAPDGTKHFFHAVRTHNGCFWRASHTEKKRFWTLWGRQVNAIVDDIEGEECPAERSRDCSY